MVFCLFPLYGRFLSISTASTAPITIMMIANAAIPSSNVDVDAKPVTGEDVGAVVAGLCTYMPVSAVDPQ